MACDLWGVIRSSAVMRRELWRYSQGLPHHSRRLLWYWFLHGPMRRTGLAQRLIGGIRVIRHERRTELRFPTGDVLFHPGKSVSSDYDAIALHFYVMHLGQYFSVIKPDPGATVVDVGANIGCFAVAVARVIGPGGGIVCCEPVPENVECLRLTLEANGVSNVSIVTGAVGESAGTLKLNLGPGCGVHSAVQWQDAESIEVPVATLDQIVAAEGLERVDFLKIDVEGMEAEVLRGAVETLRRDKPQIVMAGYHKPDDMELLPRLLREIEPAYKVAWDSRPIWGETDIAAWV